MPAPTGNWARTTAHRLGLGGQIEFTVAAVGQTLHVLCKKGAHVVDVPIAARQHPDAIAKKMLHDGWVIGSKLTCPECARQVKETRVERAKKARGAGSGWAQKLVEARRAKYTPEQLSEISRQAGKMGTGVIPKGKVELKQENPPMVSQKAIEMSGAALPVIATAGSEGAKRAHRMVMMALEDYYDEGRKCYKPGHSDKTIADSTGSSETHVRETRSSFFGPLGEHPDLAELRERLDKAVETIEAIYLDAKARHAAALKEIDAIKARMERVCIKNGWPVQ